MKSCADDTYAAACFRTNKHTLFSAQIMTLKGFFFTLVCLIFMNAKITQGNRESSMPIQSEQTLAQQKITGVILDSKASLQYKKAEASQGTTRGWASFRRDYWYILTTNNCNNSLSRHLCPNGLGLSFGHFTVCFWWLPSLLSVRLAC